MKDRCTNVKNPYYRYYGGRGITFCERWKKFENFLEDMGVRPEDKTLDRINGNGNYELNNCRWATRSEQQLNRRPSTHCRNGHLYTPETTGVNNSGANKGTRHCLVCTRERNKQKERVNV